MTATSEGPAAAVHVDVASQLAVMEAHLAELSGELVPERVAAHELGRVVRLLGRIERRAGGARLVLTKAAADVGAWKAAGSRSPEEWAARQHGTTLGEARSDLRASQRLAGLPAARAAAASGDLSAEATKAVVEGASADPTVEASLVERARRGDLADVRDEARKVRVRADERNGRAARRMHDRRGLRAWVELDGEGRGAWNVPPAYQARFLAALEPYRAEAFRVAREAGRRENPEALMADALDLLALDVLQDLGLDPPDQPATDPPADDSGVDDEDPEHGDDGTDGATSLFPEPRPAPAGAAGPAGESGAAPSTESPAVAGPGRSGPRLGERRRGRGNRKAPVQVMVHVDYQALMRGHRLDGEMCEIAGIGPVPVSLARTLAADAVLRVLVTGTADDATIISSTRRYIPAPLRTAIEARDRTCVVPGCHVRHHLEIDHVHTPFGQGGRTELANLARLCRFHHALKTHAGWTLTGQPGTWTLHPP